MKVIKRLPPEKVEELTLYIQGLSSKATPERAACARGRLNFWLQAEPNYATRKYRSAVKDDRLWSFIQRIDPGAACAQVYFATGGKGIDWHRDASYAQPIAHIVNLGKVILESEDLVSLDLTGGEIIQFDCKRRHRAIPVCDQRIGIGIWRDKISITNPDNWE